MRAFARRWPARPIDLERLALINESDPDILSDAGKLEQQILPRLGLNDEQPQEFPAQLRENCGQGLLHWQYPNQFAPYLAELARHDIHSYLEIGVRHGGTFLITLAYLRRFSRVDLAMAVDLAPNATLERLATSDPAIVFERADSTSARFARTMRRAQGFDLALIDGDHSEEGCWQDFRLVQPRARLLAFHDIVSDACPGVGAVWRQVRLDYADAYDFHEFTAQYPDVVERTGQSFLGIGLAVPRSASA